MPPAPARPTLALLLLVLVTAAAADKPPAPPARSRAEFIDALRAAYEGKVDARGGRIEVVVDSPPGSGVWIQRGGIRKRYPSAKLVPGDPAPAVLAASWLNTPSGPPETRGKVVWIEFSATWCGPCVESMPRVRQIHDRLRDKGLVVILVTDEPAEVFSSYLKRGGYAMPAATGVSRDVVVGSFGVRGWPTAILVGRDGRIAHLGDPRDEDIETIIRSLLDAPPPPASSAAGR